MKITELKISFLTAEGLDGELTVELDAADRPSLIIKSLSEKLVKEAGCKPKPQPRSGNGGWQKKPVELVPDQNCPLCGAGMVSKSGTSQKTGKPYSGYACVEKCGGWVNPSIAPVPTVAPAMPETQKKIPSPDTNNANAQPNKSSGLVAANNATRPGRALSASTIQPTGAQKQWANR